MLQQSCLAAKSRCSCRRGCSPATVLGPDGEGRSSLQAARKHVCLSSRSLHDVHRDCRGQCTTEVGVQQPQRSSIPQHATHHFLGRIAKPIVMGLMASAFIASPLVPNQFAPTAAAGDFVSVGTCLLAKCQLQLAECLADAQCLQNVVCLNACNGQPDETGCQIRCGRALQPGLRVQYKH
jgi:hypothetical protein